MDPSQLTIILGLVITAIGTITIPIWVTKRSERRAAAAKAIEDAADEAAGSAVSWEGINKAIVRERDLLQERLTKQDVDHRAEIDSMREHHRREITELRDNQERDAAEMRRGLDQEASEMKQRYDEELSRMSTRLAECQSKVSQLYADLYEMRRNPKP